MALDFTKKCRGDRVPCGMKISGVSFDSVYYSIMEELKGLEQLIVAPADTLEIEHAQATRASHTCSDMLRIVSHLLFWSWKSFVILESQCSCCYLQELLGLLNRLAGPQAQDVDRDL